MIPSVAKSGPIRKKSLKGTKKGPLFSEIGTKKGPVFLKIGTSPNNQGTRIISRQLGREGREVLGLPERLNDLESAS